MLTVLAGKNLGGGGLIMLVEAACVWSSVCVFCMLLLKHTCSLRIEGNSTEMMIVNAASSEEG